MSFSSCDDWVGVWGRQSLPRLEEGSLLPDDCRTWPPGGHVPRAGFCRRQEGCRGSFPDDAHVTGTAACCRPRSLGCCAAQGLEEHRWPPGLARVSQM